MAPGDGLKRSRRLRVAVILLLSIPIVIPLMAAALIWLSEGEATRAAEARVAQAARLAAADIQRHVRDVQRRLDAIDRSLGEDASAFNLANAPEASNGEGFVGLYDAAGLTVSRNGTRGASVATNPDFRALAAGKPWTVTALIAQGPLHLVGIAHRIERGGRFAGVVTVYLQADFLSELWASLALGPDSTIGLFRDDGWMVTRYPVPDAAINLANYELFTEHLKKAASGVYRPTASPIDGHARIVGYETVDDLGLIVIASMSRNETSDAFWSRVKSTALVAAPAFIALLVVCIGLTLLLVRQERSRIALEAAMVQNRLLMQEIHHRVKNSLQAIASLVQLQAAPQEMKDQLTKRISIIAAMHRHMYETEQFGSVNAAEHLGKVLDSLRAAAPLGVALDWRLQPVTLSPDQALQLGLLINEAVTNAFKHAFPDQKSGAVSVTLSHESGKARLVVSDTGIGWRQSNGAGLGSRLIAGFVTQLKGQATSRAGDDGAGYVLEVLFPAKEADGPS